MSLDYDLRKCNLGVRNELEEMETQAVIFSTMFVGMNTITKDNWKEFYTRVRIWERSFGSYLCKWEGDVKTPLYVTPEIVEQHIGLHTNANPKTKAQFKNDVFRNLQEDADKDLRNWDRQTENAKGAA
jgi:hypothetical protein